VEFEEEDMAVKVVETPLIPGPLVELDDVNAVAAPDEVVAGVLVVDDGELGRVPR
jgi:hypothetical protein